MLPVSHAKVGEMIERVGRLAIIEGNLVSGIRTQ
jgi:hypothetical protein